VGELDRWAGPRAAGALEMRDALMDLARTETLASNLPTLERIQQQLIKSRQVNEIAVVEATGFPRVDSLIARYPFVAAARSPL